MPILNENYARPQEYHLWNVNNTSDAAKPVSTATQVVVDEKLDLDGGTFQNGKIFNSVEFLAPNSVPQMTQKTINGGIEWDSDVPMQYKLSQDSDAITMTNPNGSLEWWRMNTSATGGQLVHGTNRQVNSQPIGIQEIDAGTSISIDCNDATSIYICTSTADTTVTVSNPYAGKFISLCNTAETGRIALPVITEDYKYGADLLTSVSAVIGRGLNLLCVDTGGPELLWMVVDN